MGLSRDTFYRYKTAVEDGDVDALDSSGDRLVLANIARQIKAPMVHGAVAGFEGRILVVLPGDESPERRFVDNHHKIQYIDSQSKNPTGKPHVPSKRSLLSAKLLYINQQIFEAKRLAIELQ